MPSIYDAPVTASTPLPHNKKFYDTPQGGSPLAQLSHKTGTSGLTKVGGYIEPISGALLGTGPFDKSKKPKKPKPTLEQRIYGKGRSQLRANNALLGPTLDLYGRTAAGYGDIYRTEADKASQHDLNMFEALAPQYVRAIDAADPQQKELRRKLNDTVTADLGSSLSPSIAREIVQGSRAAWSQRGLYNTSPSAIAELYALGDRGYKQHNQAIANALNVGGFNQRVTGDPFLAVTGRASTPQGSNPMAPDYNHVSQDSLSMVLNEDIMKSQKRAADDANRTALIGAGISAAGSLAGGAAGAFI